MKKKLSDISASLRSTLGLTERQHLLNNGIAGMRNILFYLDTIANKVDALEKEIRKKEKDKLKD